MPYKEALPMTSEGDNLDPPSSSKLTHGRVKPQLETLAELVLPDGSADGKLQFGSSEQNDDALRRIARLRALAAMVRTEDARQHLIDMIDLLEGELDAGEQLK
jgi:hypothetical protein